MSALFEAFQGDAFYSFNKDQFLTLEFLLRHPENR